MSSSGTSSKPSPGPDGKTPGSGKRKNRKKNSPRQNQTGDENKTSTVQPPSISTAFNKPDDNLGATAQSGNQVPLSGNEKQIKVDLFSQLKDESGQILKEKEKLEMTKEQSSVSGKGETQAKSKVQKKKGTPKEGEKTTQNKGDVEGGGILPKNTPVTLQGKNKSADQKSETPGKNQGQKKVKGEGQDKPKVQGQSGSAEKASDTPQKSKAELKAERRALQEAQRAAKEKKKTEGVTAPSAKKEMPRVPENMQADVQEMRKKKVKKLEKHQLPVRTEAQRKVRLFDHLHQYERERSLTQSLSFSSGGIHPAIVKLGLQYAEGIIAGSNARCIGLLAALKKVISDYSTPPHKELCRDLDAKIKPYISFLTQCRPLSVSMGNAIKYIKFQITNIPGDMSDLRAKEELLNCIDQYWEEKIRLAGMSISEKVLAKIADGDVIVVYACSSLIRNVLIDAHNTGKKFRVIVVDSRPRLEGKEMLRRLVKVGIKCSYVLITAASYIMKEATKVLLGAHALLANGFVMSRVGTSMIALIAKSYSIPVMVCCETYKFCKRVQTDSFVCNELGDPDDLVITGKKDPYLMDWRDYKSLSLLNLVYDVTPPEFISMVITELGMLPCTSVPVVLRVKYLETNDM